MNMVSSLVVAWLFAVVAAHLPAALIDRHVHLDGFFASVPDRADPSYSYWGHPALITMDDHTYLLDLSADARTERCLHPRGEYTPPLPIVVEGTVVPTSHHDSAPHALVEGIVRVRSTHFSPIILAYLACDALPSWFDKNKTCGLGLLDRRLGLIVFKAAYWLTDVVDQARTAPAVRQLFPAVPDWLSIGNYNWCT